MQNYEDRKNQIVEVTEEEANRILDEWKRILIGEGRTWGGLFLYRSLRRGNHWFRKYDWIAIDDSAGQLHVQSFTSREKAVSWLCKSTGPKLVRI